MKGVSKMSFLKATFGMAKNKKNYCCVSLLDEFGEPYKFFCFEDSNVYKKLQNASTFNQLDDVVISYEIRSYNNRIVLGDIERGK